MVPANNGWQGIGTFAKAGLILNLDAYAKGYGWGDRIPATLAKMHQVAADGSQIGTGSWFGAPIAQGGFIHRLLQPLQAGEAGHRHPHDVRGVQAEPECGQGGR